MTRPDDQCIRCGQRGHQSSSCKMPYATGKESLAFEAQEQRALYPSPEMRFALATKLQAEHPGTGSGRAATSGP